MRARWLWASVTSVGATLGASWALLSTSACGDVESCKEGTRGCIGAAPDDSGNCAAGLVRNAAGTECVERGNEGSAAPDSGMPPQSTCGSCQVNELCRVDGTCVNACTTPNPLPAFKSAALACRPGPSQDQYDMTEAGLAICYQGCIRRAELCGTTCDPTKECTNAVAATLASAGCGPTDVECAMKRCEEVRDTPCATQQCPGSVQPNCTGVVCSNTCSNPEFRNDGLCDDGDISNGYSSACAWGTDCGDCGPRRGAPPKAMLDLGDLCIDAPQCGGNSQTILRSTGWCLQTDLRLSLNRCLPDCSGPGETCPSGYTCDNIVFVEEGQDPSKADPLQDAAGTFAKACFPMLCGVPD